MPHLADYFAFCVDLETKNYQFYLIAHQDIFRPTYIQRRVMLARNEVENVL